MAKKIVILGVGTQNNIFNNVDAVFWFPITSGAQTQANGSAWSGASAGENTAIQNGTVLEERTGFQFPVGVPSGTIEAILLQHWTNRNAQINGKGPALFGGTFNDSVSGWSA